MADQQRSRPYSKPQPPAYTGPERRSGLNRRQEPNPQQLPPAGEDRRKGVRRRVEQLYLDRASRAGGGGTPERVYQRVRVEVPEFYRSCHEAAAPARGSRQGLTCTLAPGGLGMLLAEEFSVGTGRGTGAVRAGSARGGCSSRPHDPPGKPVPTQLPLHAAGRRRQELVDRIPAHPGPVGLLSAHARLKSGPECECDASPLRSRRSPRGCSPRC